MALLFVATLYYPGGSQSNLKSVGYTWGDNYLCNLFSPKAMDGADNASRPWATLGMFFLCASFCVFFIDFSGKINSKVAAGIIKYTGAGSMILAFFAVTPLHDIVVTVSSTFALIACFYITVFILKSKLHFLKLLSITCLLIFYCCEYLYFTRSYLNLLPIMQKVSFVVDIIWVLWLGYFTTAEDFEFDKAVKTKLAEETAKG